MIGTPDRSLTIGEKYDYKEGGFVGECMFLGDESSDELTAKISLFASKVLRISKTVYFNTHQTT
jgi:hypothetical protein